jgi:hypothetical protein
VEIHKSARRHNVSDDDIEHALAAGPVHDALEPDADQPTFLRIGPSRAGTLLEVIWIDLAGERMLAIHAMKLEPICYDLLTEKADTT